MPKIFDEQSQAYVDDGVILEREVSEIQIRGFSEMSKKLYKEKEFLKNENDSLKREISELRTEVNTLVYKLNKNNRSRRSW